MRTALYVRTRHDVQSPPQHDIPNAPNAHTHLSHTNVSNRKLGGAKPLGTRYNIDVPKYVPRRHTPRHIVARTRAAPKAYARRVCRCGGARAPLDRIDRYHGRVWWGLNIILVLKGRGHVPRETTYDA